MYVPHRVLLALRVSTEMGLVLATAVATATFVATPLVLSAVAERFSVSVGTAALFSASQLGWFVVGSWTAGRFVQPSARLFVASLLVLALSNLVSAVVTAFVLLVIVRGVAGLALGVLTWLSYSQVFGNAERTSDIAVVGPITGVVVAPLFGLLLRVSDVRSVFVVLAVVALVPLVAIPRFSAIPQRRDVRNRAMPAALVLVGALGFVTLGGSAVFVFTGAIAADRFSLGAFELSLVFSANAAAGIPAARWRGARPLAGAWFLVPAICALAIGRLSEPAVFVTAIVVWGFAFWVAVPGTYNLLAERSRFPAERAGDAQAVMAAGRSVGPLLGASLVAGGSYAVLTGVGALILAAAALVIVSVELGSSPAVTVDG